MNMGVAPWNGWCRPLSTGMGPLHVTPAVRTHDAEGMSSTFPTRLTQYTRPCDWGILSLVVDLVQPLHRPQTPLVTPWPITGSCFATYHGIVNNELNRDGHSDNK